jgi:hypothetical protein
MTSAEILALPPGPELDKAVHLFVFSNDGKARYYSTKDADGIRLLDKLPLFVARIPDNHPNYEASRPFCAGTLIHNPDVKGDMTALRVTASTRLVALCKAALIVVLRPAKTSDRQAATPQGSSANAANARDLAARIGTPAARRGGAGRILQPTARGNPREQRQPIPKRPERFIGPNVQRPPNA